MPAQVKLYSRPGNDLTYRFPLIVETLARFALLHYRWGGLISCSHSLPEGSLLVLLGRHGAMNPAGRVRCNMSGQ
jgi:hypothetical protein